MLAFAVAGTGCYGTGECPQGVCTEEHSKKSAGEVMEEEAVEEEAVTEEAVEEKAAAEEEVEVQAAAEEKSGE